MEEIEKYNNFYQRVYRVVCQIPVGRVTTYGAIAQYLGNPQSARMVGWAMNRSYNEKKYIPAHRVVNRNGFLTGKYHFNGEKLMQELLESEGIIVKGDRVQNFVKVFWKPA